MASTAFIARYQEKKSKGWLMLKRPELPDGFQGRGFKCKVRERVTGNVISSCTVL